MTLSTVSCPPWAATISCTIYSPNPVPPGFVVYNGSKIVVSCFAGIPLPVSCTCSCTWVAGRCPGTVRIPTLWHGVERILHEIEERTAERAGMQRQRAQGCDAFQPKGHALR